MAAGVVRQPSRFEQRLAAVASRALAVGECQVGVDGLLVVTGGRVGARQPLLVVDAFAAAGALRKAREDLRGGDEVTAAVSRFGYAVVVSVACAGRDHLLRFGER